MIEQMTLTASGQPVRRLFARTKIAIVLLSAFALLSARLARAAEVVFEEGIEYANPDEQHLKLNLAHPKEVKEGERLPAVICIHGGGFRAGDRKSYDALCKRLAEQGYVAVTVTYRLAPKYPFPAAVYDVKQAVRWMRANAQQYHVDPDRIAALGGSAGGHLALFLGVTGDVKQFDPPAGEALKDAADSGVSTRVQCVVSYYGPSDFTKSYGKSVDAAEVLPLFLGGDLEHERHRHIIASPLNWVTPEAPPTLLLQGTEDKYVNHEQAVWMYDRMKAADVEVDLQSLEGAGHGFKGEDAKKADASAIDFLDKHLKSGASSSASLYDRLGGEPAVTAIIDDFIGKVGADPAVNFTRQGHPNRWDPTPDSVAVLKKHLVQFFQMTTGGPQKYEGRDMADSHKGMEISEAEWKAIIEDFTAALKDFKVPDKEQAELLTAVAGTHDHIVGK